MSSEQQQKAVPASAAASQAEPVPVAVPAGADGEERKYVARRAVQRADQQPGRHAALGQAAS